MQRTSSGLAAGLVGLLVGCGVTTEPVPTADLGAQSVVRSGHWLPAAAPVDRLAPSAAVTPRVAQRCPAGAVAPSTIAMNAAPPSVANSGLFVVTRDEATLHARLQRLGGQGCKLEPQLEFTYQDVEVADGLLSAGDTNVFVSQGSSVQQVNHRRCGETTAGPFRWVAGLAVSPSEQTLVVQNCGSWFGLRLDASGWVHHDAASQALLPLQASANVVLLDDAHLAALDVDGLVTVVAFDSAEKATLDVRVDGVSPRPESLVRCGHGAVCLAYPGGGFVARWSDTGALLDLVRVEGLADGEQVVGVAREHQGGGLYVLLSGPAGASLAYAP